MKKAIFATLILFASAGISAASSTDGKVFLDPYVNNLSDAVSAVSINIGKNLPTTTHIVSEEACSMVGLTAHFKGLAKRLSHNEEALVSSPASFGVLFTNGAHSDEEVRAHVDEVLVAIGPSNDSEFIASSLNQLSDVTRAAFVRRGEQLVLVTNERELKLGEAIWYKTSEGVEQNVYHSEEEYLISLRNAGLQVEEIKRPCFFGEVKWKMYNSSLAKQTDRLGPAYKENHPFTLYYVRKV